MPPPPLHGYDLNSSHEKYRQRNVGWGMHAGRLPMYSPVWTNDKPWVQKVAARLGSTLEEIPNLVAFYLPFLNRRSTRSFITGKVSMTTSNQSSSVFLLLCGLWYTTSALSSNTGKTILNQFRFPITLTFVQFGFVASYCLLFMSPLVRFSTLRLPTREIISSTFPMGLFQVGGHIFSSIAISRIPVSTVHTIKALSPLFTVAAYALLFGVSYSTRTYMSLLPLTFGVMLACSFDVSASNAIGIFCAFGSALVFVSSNIFFKKIMPSPGSGALSASHKLDKMNLLLYSSGMAFVLMIPIWVYYDLPLLLSNAHATVPKGGTPPHSVAYYFFLNGTVHYAQNIIAFIILSSTSPVTYSIASLIKRVAVICIAIIWFNQAVHPIQAFGICMTFIGLYMYNNAKGDIAKGEKKLRRIKANQDMMLPTTKDDPIMLSDTDAPDLSAEHAVHETQGIGSGTLYGRTITTFHQHHRSPPVLHVQTSESTPTVKISVASPVDLYPSPPLSDDSPLPETKPLRKFDAYENQVRTGYHVHHHHTNHPRLFSHDYSSSSARLQDTN